MGAMFTRALALAVAAVAVFGSCRDDAGSPTQQGERPEGSVRPAGALPACFDRDGARTTDSLTGDVDGDGDDDEVTVVVAPEGEPGCRAFLIVRGEQTLVAAVEVLDDSVIRLGLPTPQMLAEIDGEPGAEIAVKVHVGASTEFAALFTVADSRLVQMSIASSPDDLVALGGSVTHVEGADCRPDGSLVVAEAVPRGRRYAVTRTVLRAEGGALVVAAEKRRTVRSRDLDSVPEFAGLPFGSCA